LQNRATYDNISTKGDIYKSGRKEMNELALKIKIKEPDKLLEAIYKNGFTIRTLARDADLSDTTVQLLVDGTRSGCTATTAKRILKVLEPFGFKFDDFFYIVNVRKSGQNETAATSEEALSA
jgi:predicted nucleic acid-binding Zn ribbon protein